MYWQTGHLDRHAILSDLGGVGLFSDCVVLVDGWQRVFPRGRPGCHELARVPTLDRLHRTADSSARHLNVSHTHVVSALSSGDFTLGAGPPRTTSVRQALVFKSGALRCELRIPRFVVMVGWVRGKGRWMHSTRPTELPSGFNESKVSTL